MNNLELEMKLDALTSNLSSSATSSQDRFNYLKNIAQTYDFNNKIQGKVIHLAGTNGKGSTSQILWHLLKAQGYQCHLIRSPHLIKYNERIHLNNQMIDNDTLANAISWAENIIDRPIGITILTMAFFKCCMDYPADFIILETGLGGEFDATNILQDHALSVITPISYDHCDLLGNTLTEIASAKAGIMRPNRPCISAIQQPETKNKLSLHAAEMNTPISFLDDTDFTKNDQGFILYQQQYSQPSLVGEHQKENAALAVLAYQALIPKTQQLTLDEINKTLQNTSFTGRLHPMPSGKLTKQLKHDIWIDGAHNPAGAKQLIPFFKKQQQPIYFWLNFKDGKDIKTILEITCSYADKIIFQMTNDSNRATKDKIKNITDELNINIIFSDDINSSIQKFNANPQGLVLAFGSLHWVGYLLKITR